MKKNIIALDLGATKCAAGLAHYDTETKNLSCSKHSSLKLTDATSLENLISQLEKKLDFSFSHADAICVGAAGHYDGKEIYHDRVYPYRMNFYELAKSKKWPAYDVVHDYVPIVCATFTSYMENPENIKRLNSCAVNPLGRRVALGVGTGLGLKDGVLLSSGEFWLGKNEMGHIGISIPPSLDKTHRERHDELIRFLHVHEPITFEKILSGHGLVRLYQFFYSNKEITPEQVGIEMREGRASDVMDAFAWYLGLLVGTVQLSFMPEGGIWITGGVALNHLEIFDKSEFFSGIHSSPAYLSQREHYPLGVLCNHHHAFLGGAYYAAKRLL